MGGGGFSRLHQVCNRLPVYGLRRMAVAVPKESHCRDLRLRKVSGVSASSSDPNLLVSYHLMYPAVGFRHECEGNHASISFVISFS